MITESPLSRTQKYLENYDCATISAFRPITKSENKNASGELGELLKKTGYTYFLVDGSWIDNFGTDKAKESKELTYFVANTKNDKDFKKIILKLGEHFDQDAVMIYPKGSYPYLQGTSKRSNAYPPYGQKEQKGKIKYGEKAEFMTKVNGRPFTVTDSSVMSESYFPY